MKIDNAVQTEEKDKAIINKYASDNNLTGGYFKNTSRRITWYKEKVNELRELLQKWNDSLRP